MALNDVSSNVSKLAHGDRIGIGQNSLLFLERSLSRERHNQLRGGPRPRYRPAVAPSFLSKVDPVQAAGTLRLETLGGQVIPLASGRCAIGRDPSSIIDLANDQRASRRHAEISVVDKVAVLCDLGSTNGTILNGQTISGDAILRDGDEVLIGSTVFRFRA